MKKNYLYIILMIIFINACFNTPHFGKLDITESMQKEINSRININKIIIYYHSGDCSICYATLIALSKEFPELPLVSVSASQDNVLIDYYMEQIGFKGISLIDSNSMFLKSNLELLKAKNIFLIDLQNNILTEGSVLDRSTKRSITHVMQEY